MNKEELEQGMVDAMMEGRDDMYGIYLQDYRALCTCGLIDSHPLDSDKHAPTCILYEPPGLGEEPIESCNYDRS